MDRGKGGRRREPPRSEIIERVAIGETVRCCRTAEGMTQGDLLYEFSLHRLELNPNTISTWECAESRPNDLHMRVLKVIFDNWETHYARIQSDVLRRAEAEPALGGDELVRFLRYGVAGPTIGKERAHWIETNHSRPRIERVALGANDPEFAYVTRVVREHYAKVVAKPSVVERFRHAVDGRVYCVGETANNPVLVVKIVNSRREPYQMRDLARAQRAMLAHNVFGRYSQYLAAVVTADGRTWIDRPDGGPITAFRFMPEVAQGRANHFQGSSLDEIEDIGRKFGRVNNILVDLRVGGKGFRGYTLDPSGWEATIDRLKSGAEVEGSPALRYALDRCRYIQQAFLQLAELVEPHHHRARDAYPVSLADLHPRNVFTMEGRCLLIYDYEEARNEYPEVANLVFSAHRFVREYVREKPDGSDLREACRQAALCFVRGYRTARPRRVLEEAVASGTLWAKAVNFSKLVANLRFEFGETDPIGRTREQHFEEVRKFVSYLQELDKLEELDWLAPVRDQLL